MGQSALLIEQSTLSLRPHEFVWWGLRNVAHRHSRSMGGGIHDALVVGLAVAGVAIGDAVLREPHHSRIAEANTALSTSNSVLIPQK